MYVYLTNLHTLWKLKSSYKDGAFDPIFGKKCKTDLADVDTILKFLSCDGDQ